MSPTSNLLTEPDGKLRVKVNRVDVFHPNTGEVRSDGPDPYKSLKTTLKAEIDADAWEALHSDTSRPFTPPTTGRIAVKVINHLGDEVMKVFRI